MKLKRGTFSATFFLACLAAMELEGVVLEEFSPQPIDAFSTHPSYSLALETEG